MNPTQTEAIPAQTAPDKGPVRALPTVNMTQLVLRSMAIGLDVAKQAKPWIALLSSTAMFAYTLHDPTLLKLGVSVAYTILVYLWPALMHKEG